MFFPGDGSKSATLRIVMLVTCLGVLSSCATTATTTAPQAQVSQIPLPSPSLLRAPPAPRCQFTAGKARKRTENGKLSNNVRLEFERNCYREAEQRVRSRLRELQRAVSLTTEAVERITTTTTTN